MRLSSAVILLAALVAAGCVDGNQRKDQVGETVVGQSLARAKDVDCMNNLRSVRQMIQVAVTSSDTPPATMDEMRVSKSMQQCPIGKEPYRYEAGSATVNCPHPGHEKY